MKTLVLKDYKRHSFTIDPSVKEVISQWRYEVVLAGGAIRDGLKGREVMDYDLFFYNLHISQRVKEFLVGKGFKVVFACPEGKLYTLKKEGVPKVQLICKRAYTGVEDLFQSFDFSICQFATECGEKIVTTKQAIVDNDKMVLSLVGLEYPTSTINRVGKYKAKGFWVGDAIQDIVMTLVEMDRSQYDPDDDTLYVD